MHCALTATLSASKAGPSTEIGEQWSRWMVYVPTEIVRNKGVHTPAPGWAVAFRTREHFGSRLAHDPEGECVTAILVWTGSGSTSLNA